MAGLFRKSYTVPIPDDAERLTVKGVASARFKQRKKTITAPLTTDGTRVRITSPFYYGRVHGKTVRLFKDEVASRQRLAELVRNAERGQTDLADPCDGQRRRPLAEHVDEWEAAMRNDGAGSKHVRQFSSCMRRIVEGCKFVVIADLSASRVQQFLADLREDRQTVATIDPAKQFYTRAELAALLHVKPCAVTSLIKRHRLPGEGQGKRRRFPKSTAEALCETRNRGASIRTSNLYLAAAKAFCNWLVQDRRALENPLEHLSGGNVEMDRRRDRRILDEMELRQLLAEAAASTVTYRGMAGPDREALYLVACVTGFRAGELAALCPKDFALEGDTPEVTLSGVYTKNQKPAT
jgi:integrase